MTNICNIDEDACTSCALQGRLMCHFRVKDTLFFIPAGLAFWVIIVIGMVRTYQNHTMSLGWFISFFVVYALYLAFFFQIWENKILCSHCPYYAFENEKRLHCYANAGIYKLWPYNPAPMTRSEKYQFLFGFLLFWVIPASYLIVGQEFLYFSIATAIFLLWGIVMQFTGCKICVNFSCPLNRVKKDVRDAFVQKNELLKKIWEDNGYKLEEKSKE